jgi:hypothetical protein
MVLSHAGALLVSFLALAAPAAAIALEGAFRLASASGSDGRGERFFRH